jgi:flagellar hook-basal body complex protein FliE
MQVEMLASQATLLGRMEEMSQVAAGEQIAPATLLAGSEVSATSFADVFSSAVNQVNSLQNSAAAQMQAVELGQSTDMVGAMITAQKAGLSFSALVQSRNKVMTGFDDIMNMAL